MNSSDFNEVTRLEVINHTDCEGCKGVGRIKIGGVEGSFECPACHGLGMIGRTVVFHNDRKEIQLSLQDDGRTLKIFVKKREQIIND